MLTQKEYNDFSTILEVANNPVFLKTEELIQKRVVLKLLRLFVLEKSEESGPISLVDHED
jgi:hypothetical protein